MNHLHTKTIATLAALLLTNVTLSPAQTPWSLAQCCDYAVEHNISLQQQANQRAQQELQLSTARSQRLPDLNASAGQNFSFGRGLTAQNTYTNTNTQSTSFSVGTSVPLFTGFLIPNQIRLSRLNLEAATADLEKARNDVRMQVAQAYVQVLYDMEIADVAQRQVSIDSQQVARLQALHDVGRASRAELAQQQATLAQSQLTATQARGQLQLQLLALSQLLELPSPEGFTVERPTDELLARGADEPLPDPDAIFADALALKPEVRSQQLRVEAAQRSIDVARAALYPTLSFSAGLGTNYYKTSGYAGEAFGRQLENNFSQYLGLNLSVPVFNRFQTRNNIRSARLSHDSQQLQLASTKKALYKEIQQAYYNTLTARDRLHSCLTARDSGMEAFRLMQAKYENGKASATEFNEAKNNYLKAESDLTQARYEFLYQRTLVSFYRGAPLAF